MMPKFELWRRKDWKFDRHAPLAPYRKISAIVRGRVRRQECRERHESGATKRRVTRRRERPRRCRWRGSARRAVVRHQAPAPEAASATGQAPRPSPRTQRSCRPWRKSRRGHCSGSDSQWTRRNPGEFFRQGLVAGGASGGGGRPRRRGLHRSARGCRRRRIGRTWGCRRSRRRRRRSC